MHALNPCKKVCTSMAIDSDMICIQIYMYDKIWCKTPYDLQY